MRTTSYLAAVARQLYLQAMSSCAEIRGRVPRHLFMAMEIHGPLVQLARHCLVIQNRTFVAPNMAEWEEFEAIVSLLVHVAFSHARKEKRRQGIVRHPDWPAYR